MKITERDFKIERDGSNYILYLLKTKKELKEDLKENKEVGDTYKIKGYYTVLFNAIQDALIWRMSEKYPFKESVLEFKKDFIRYRNYVNELNSYLDSIYSPIIQLEKQIFNEHREFFNK